MISIPTIVRFMRGGFADSGPRHHAGWDLDRRDYDARHGAEPTSARHRAAEAVAA